MARGDARQKIFRNDGIMAASWRDSSRDVAVWLARRVTTATLRELSCLFGLSHPDSVRKLIRNAEQAMEQSRTFRKEVDQILQTLRKKDENRV